MLSIHPAHLLLAAIVVCLCRQTTTAFAPASVVAQTRCCATSFAFLLKMGLYDKPLPPLYREEDPSNDDDNNNDDKEDEDQPEDFVSVNQVARLFELLPSGEEKNGLLPRLGRRLDDADSPLGFNTVYDETDKEVQNLVRRTECHPMDACWALEATRGDIVEAWTLISVARRNKLQQQAASSNNEAADDETHQETDWDQELFSLLNTPQDNVVRPLGGRDEYEARKAQMAKEEEKRNARDLLQGGTPDEPWLPKSNPRPIDDEPWFTG